MNKLFLFLNQLIRNVLISQRCYKFRVQSGYFSLKFKQKYLAFIVKIYRQIHLSKVFWSYRTDRWPEKLINARSSRYGICRICKKWNAFSTFRIREAKKGLSKLAGLKAQRQISFIYTTYEKVRNRLKCSSITWGNFFRYLSIFWSN